MVGNQAGVLLINPPFQEGYGRVSASSGVLPPIGLAYIAASLERGNIPVRILDANVLGMIWKQVSCTIKELKPMMVGMTVMTPIVPHLRKLAQLAKAVDNDITVVAGGPHPSSLPGSTLRLIPEIDIEVIGEGDETILDLTRAIKEHASLEEVSGIAYRAEGEIRITKRRPFIQNLDSLTFPSYHLLPIERYQPRLWELHDGPNIPYISMITTRGCPNYCVFCDSHRVFGRNPRFRSAQNVLEEVDYLVCKHKVKTIFFHDDTFTLDLSRVEEICEGLIQRDYDLKWICQSRVDNVTLEILETMKKAGCYLTLYGVESGNQYVLDKIGKKITLEQARRAIALTRKVGMRSIATFIIGHHVDTHKTIQDTIQFANKLDPDTALFFLLVPYPGTAAYQYAIKHNLLTSNAWEGFVASGNEPVFVPKGLTKDDISYARNRAYRTFYLKPHRVWRLLFGMRSIRHIVAYAQGLMDVIS